MSDEIKAAIRALRHAMEGEREWWNRTDPELIVEMQLRWESALAALESWLKRKKRP